MLSRLREHCILAYEVKLCILFELIAFWQGENT